MALLQPPDSSYPVPLAGHTLVGRGSACNLRLEDRFASAEHAAISWREGGWSIRDLGSSNGTFVDGRRLDPGEQVSITVGSRICFGYEESVWRMEDSGPPKVAAVRDSDGARRLEEDGLLLLPDDETPELMVLLDGENDQWMLEGEDAVEPVADGAVITAGGDRWRLYLPIITDGTRKAPPQTLPAGGAPLISLSTVCFRVSRDEEYVELALTGPHGAFDVPARVHHYLLLTLARARIAESELPVFGQGWLHYEDLGKMLAVDRLGLNTQVSRARRQLASLGVRDANKIVERRASSGHLRLGVVPEKLIIETP